MKLRAGEATGGSRDGVTQSFSTSDSVFAGGVGKLGRSSLKASGTKSENDNMLSGKSLSVFRFRSQIRTAQSYRSKVPFDGFR